MKPNYNESLIKVKFLRHLWILSLLLSLPSLVISQNFCLSEPTINKQRKESKRGLENLQPCKIYWISVYLHRIQGFGNDWQDYGADIDTKIIRNLNSTFNEYGFYFQLTGARDWFTNTYSDPDRHAFTLLGIFDDPGSFQHDDAIDIYLLPLNSKINGGYVPGNNKKVMLIGGSRQVDHCSGGSTSYQIAATKVVSHEMGHCLGLPHTFEESIGTAIDYVRENACVNPSTCEFVNNCEDCNVSNNPTLNMNNYMSYTVPDCMSVFTDEQVNQMRENLNTSMESVVSKSQGMPADISGDIAGPSEVSTGSVVWFNIPDHTEGVEIFTWSIPNGFLTTGDETGNIIQAWIGPTAENGNIGVRKTNLCGSSSEKFKYITVVEDDCITCPAIKVFPNPALDRIYVSHVSDGSDDYEVFDKPKRYLLVDINGKMVYEFRSAQKGLILNLEGIKTGFYILSIEDSNTSIYRQKLTIIK